VHLLVSVSNVSEAEAALAGGADIVDAKDPAHGALGAVNLEVFRRICGACATRVPVTAALGDTNTLAAVESQARAFAAAGATLVKVGFAAPMSRAGIATMLAAAARGAAAGAGPTGVVAVAYADWMKVSSADPEDILSAACSAGAAGILLDTADKNGPGLRALMTEAEMAQWIAQAREAGLLIAAAGQLRAGDLDWLAQLGVEVAGVRGAACESGRTSRITPALVASLQARCAAASRHAQRWMGSGAAAQT
jgi:uncharacterized protein (UPF0264 family)